MEKTILGILFITFACLNTDAQVDEKYLKANAIRIDNLEKLNDSIYSKLSPFQIIMVGEMHGTNESAPFVRGLTNLFTGKGDSVQVGLEIYSGFMTNFLQLHTDSSVYQSDFFSNPPYLDGRESDAWANLIFTLNKNPKVKIFFFDTTREKEVTPFRDTLMAASIKTHFNAHPNWKIVTLSGNYHNNISYPNSMTSVLKRNITAKVCSLNMEYKEGTCNANFTHGLEVKQLGSYPSVYNSTDGFDSYFLLVPPESGYDYDGMYYTKYITAAKMISSK